MTLNNELGLDRPIQDVRHEAILSVVRTANILAGEGSTLFRKYGLTEAQFNVLFVLKYKERPWTQSDLGKSLLVTRASVTSVLDKMEEKGLVKRQDVKGNRRIYHVDLTEKGRELVDLVEPTYRKDIHQVLSEFSDVDCRKLISFLDRIRAKVTLPD